MQPNLVAEGFRTMLRGLFGGGTPPEPLGTPGTGFSSEELRMAMRPLLLAGGTACLLLIGWAALAPLDEVARANGILVASGNNSVVQHGEGGVLRRLLVNEGQDVAQGQPLLELETANTVADLAAVRSRIGYLTAQAARLSGALGRPAPANLLMATDDETGDTADPSILAAQPPEQTLSPTALLLPPPTFTDAGIEPAAGPATESALATRRQMLLQSLKVAEGEWHRQKDLRKQGFSTASREYAAQRDYQTQAQQLNQLEAELSEQLASAKTELDQQRETERKLLLREKNLIIRAPVAGTVQGLRLNTKGAYVPAGATLMELVPAGAPLQALVRLQPAYIGRAEVGQRVVVKVSAYDATQFGALEGTVTRIAADAASDEAGRAMYQVWVDVPQTLRHGRNAYPLKPGMMVVGGIVTGRHTVLEYLLKPIRRALDDAWQEG